jgi:putative pyruvate formate lyase activating enzyme
MVSLPENIRSFTEPVQKLWQMLNLCTLCPRKCEVNRLKDQTGFCKIAAEAVVSSVGQHFGEESVLVGRGGSGTIFFAGCNLGCIFCQNYDISHQCFGSVVSIEKLARYMLELQDQGCSNINFVSPTHSIPPIIAALELAKEQRLTLPIVYNTGGYDRIETLELLDGYIDIYMPDMKYSDPSVAKQLSDAADYPQINRAAVMEMHRQVGDLQLENGVATRGLLIRHLVLPNDLAGSTETIDFLAEQVSPGTAINVMDQYHPCYHAFSNPMIKRRPTSDEFLSAQKYAVQKGLNIIS